MTTTELIEILQLSGEIVNLYSQQVPYTEEITLSGAFLAKISGGINKSYLFTTINDKSYIVFNSSEANVNGTYRRVYNAAEVGVANFYNSFPVYKNENGYVIYAMNSSLFAWIISDHYQGQPISIITYANINEMPSTPSLTGWSDNIFLTDFIVNYFNVNLPENVSEEGRKILTEELKIIGKYNKISDNVFKQENGDWYITNFISDVNGESTLAWITTNDLDNISIDNSYYWYTEKMFSEQNKPIEFMPTISMILDSTVLYGKDIRPIVSFSIMPDINIENILECDFENPINNFWYNDGKLVPCKVFNYGDTNEFTLDALNTNSETEFSLVNIGDEKQLSVYFNPSDAETVGKIEWTASEELNGKIELTPSRDTLSCNVKLIEDMGTNVLSGKIIAKPLDNRHENIFNSKLEFYLVNGSLENGNEITYKLSVSNFPNVVHPSQFTQLNPNGMYELSNPTETGTNRVWVRNNEFKIYFDYPNWILTSYDETLNVKFYMGEDNLQTPYKEDGSTNLWFNSGEVIENASVILLINE